MAKTATIDSINDTENMKKVLERKFFTFKVRSLSTLITRGFNHVLQEFELTRNHWVVLACLWQQDGLPASSISAHIQQEGGTVTGVLDRMVKRNLIKRRRDRADRRVVRIWLTDQGKELAQTLPPLISNLFKCMFAELSPEDVKEFRQLIDKVIEAMCPDGPCKPAGFEPSECLVMSRFRHVLPPQCIPYKIKVLHMVIRRLFSERVAEYNVTTGHWAVLCCLTKEDGARVSDIGDHVEAAGSALSGLIERMVERGLVRKQNDPQDKRSMRVWVTQAGRDMWDRVPPIAMSLTELALSNLNSKQRRRLDVLMDRTMENLSEYERKQA